MIYKDQHLQWFVRGAVVTAFPENTMATFAYYVNTLRMVAQYLQELRELDSDFDELQTEIAIAAKKVFK